MRDFLKLGSSLLFMVSIPFSQVNATYARSDALGLKDRYWMSEKQMPYIYENPGTVIHFTDRVFFEYRDSGASGGITADTGSTVFGLFSGLPAEDTVLNSATQPFGLYDTAGNLYPELVNTGAGEDFDAAATTTLNSGRFGNLPVRVSRLDDPGFNQLNAMNLSALLAAKQGKGALGFMAEYGIARDSAKFEGITTEEQVLDKRQLSLTLGFYSEPGPLWKIFDAALNVNTYSVNNTYSGDGNDGETVRGSFKTAGAYDFTLHLRNGFKWFENGTDLFYLAVSLRDNSSVAEAESKGGYFETNTGLKINRRDNYSRIGYAYKAGISHDARLSDSVKFLSGFELQHETGNLDYDGFNKETQEYISTPYEATFTRTTIPLVLALEADASEHFQLRFALVHELLKKPGDSSYNIINIEQVRSNTSLASIDSEEKTGRIYNNSPDTAVTIGFSYRYGNLRADWYADAEIFRAGPEFLSGNTQQLSTAFSVTYRYHDFINEQFNETAPKEGGNDEQ